MILIFVTAMSGCGAERSSSVPRHPPSERGTFKGIPVGFTRQSFPYMGNAHAPVTMEEFSDFLCPFCGRHFSQTLPTLVRDYIAKGKVKYVFRDMPVASLHPNAPEGHVAARCVAEQSPELFWAMHDELFRTQDAWRDLPDPSRYLRMVAGRIGADLVEYDRCMASGAEYVRVQQSVRTGTRRLELDGTPAFRFLRRGQKSLTLVGAYPVETFEAWLAALVAGKAPPPQPQAKSSKLPYWATDKGLAPDPARPGFTVAGDPYRGSLNAGLTVVEFSNFECAPCRRHTLDTQPTLEKAFVDTGKVRWVFKNLLLRELPRSLAAAAAAECAGEQGRFWQMHDLLFAKQTQWATRAPDAKLERLATELGLDRRRFASCLGSRRVSERVLNDLYDSQGVTTTAPTFVIVGGKDVAVRGAPPRGRFVKLLREQLDSANRGQAPSSKVPASVSAQVELGTMDLGVGRNRISFVVLDPRSRPVNRPTARVWLTRRTDGRPEAASTARLEFVGAPGEHSDELSVYVATLPTPVAGRYRLLAQPTGAFRVPAVGFFAVRARASAPSVGDRAIPIPNPIAGEGTDPKTITTARPPDVELLHASVKEALAAGRPFVVTFASPLFCRKRACGSVVDVVRSVARHWRGRGVDFIHVEVYEHNEVQRGYNEWVRAWRLPSDAFTYVVDRSGVIRTKLEGAFSAPELDAAVRTVARRP